MPDQPQINKATLKDTGQGSGEAISGRWLLDPGRSTVEFRVGHFWGLMTVKGQFDDYHGQLDLSAHPAIELTINAASVRTRNRKRDQHLRSADFFDADNHPRVRFVADTVARRADTLEVRGRLSAAGRSIPLELDAHIRRVEGELEIEATAVAPQRELGMTYSPRGMIAPRSRLSVQGRLTPLADRGDEARGADRRARELTANQAEHAALRRGFDEGNDAGSG